MSQVMGDGLSIREQILLVIASSPPLRPMDIARHLAKLNGTDPKKYLPFFVREDRRKKSGVWNPYSSKMEGAGTCHFWERTAVRGKKTSSPVVSTIGHVALAGVMERTRWPLTDYETEHVGVKRKKSIRLKPGMKVRVKRNIYAYPAIYGKTAAVSIAAGTTGEFLGYETLRLSPYFPSRDVIQLVVNLDLGSGKYFFSRKDLEALEENDAA